MGGESVTATSSCSETLMLEVLHALSRRHDVRLIVWVKIFDVLRDGRGSPLRSDNTTMGYVIKYICRCIVGHT